MPTQTNRLIYQIKITLHGCRPLIWRRLLVPDSVTLFKLHQIIQIAMGWTDSHLHQFIVEDEYYGIPSPEDWPPFKDERRSSLNQVAPHENDKFVYEYDFGDSWEQEIVVEKKMPAKPGVKYPLCVKGKRACPPEDVGGVWGYADFLEAIEDPDHEEHDSAIEWAGDFDPEKFDVETVNRILQRIK